MKKTDIKINQARYISVIYRISVLLLLSVYFSSTAFSQSPGDIRRKELLKTIEYSNPDLLAPPSGNAPGFPGRPEDPDLLAGFRNPPPGYGEVPFWWWSGDPLDKERLLWQIEELHKKGITGMQVNYIHRDSPGWPTYPAEPEIFTGEWWDMWSFAAGEASKRNMGIGLSGYTIDWPGTENLFNRIIYSDKEIQGLELVADTIINVWKGKKLTLKIPDNAIEVRAYESREGKIIPGGISLMNLVSNGVLNWESDSDDIIVWVFIARRKPGTLNPMHPLAGKTVIEKFFQPFGEKSGTNGSGALNYFFQDELKFGVGDLIWYEDFDDEFRKSKGYDVFEMLPGMFADIGPATAKARLDFMDVKVRLTEERYFKPIFEWHYNRGMIYGCDPEGRGKIPGEYGDNFRANRWYTAPGHDTPSGNADLIKGKVSASIAALYRRPRVWLEGYHSLGWGATPGQLMFATSENYLYGCNLLNLHGLYYTTHGSFWEWAPPCYHFRMPYWDHMPVFLKYFERLSWLMSHGALQTDVAILYPVSTAQAKTGEKKSTSAAFASGTTLFNNGYDFLFIDDQSVIRAEIANGRLNVTDQSFKVLILPAMEAVRWTTINRALDFYSNGGVVIACGSLPSASDNAGSSDPALDSVVRQLFGVSADEMKEISIPSVQKHPSGGIAVFVKDETQLLAEVSNMVTRHVSSGEAVRYAHRKAGNRDIFFVMGAGKDSWCSFAAKGVAELWDPWSGKAIPLIETRVTAEGTDVRMPLSANEAQIIVFSPGNNLSDTIPVKEAYSYNTSPVNNTINLDGDWEFELKPTMDNRWGDFRLPVTEKIIGAEARIFRYSEPVKQPAGWEKPGYDDSEWERVTYGFGRKFWKLGPLPDETDMVVIEKRMKSLKMVNPDEPVIINDKSYYWQPYSFSWRSGVEGDPGHQGYHGLKEEITDEFICLGKPEPGLNETLYRKEKEGSLYYLWTSAWSENETNVTIDAGGLLPSEVFLNGISSGKKPVLTLRKGSNPLLLKYNAAGRGHFVLVREGASPQSAATPLSMKWWDMPGRVDFDIRPAEKRPLGIFRFTAPPGLREMTLRSNGKLRVWVDGNEIRSVAGDASGLTHKYRLKSVVAHNAVVAVQVEQRRGEYGGESFPEPVLLDCGTGITKPGDWSAGSVLENYSGGAWYRKNFIPDAKQAESDVTLDLGKVVATAEVHVNGSLAGILVAPPWKLNISPFVKNGENKIEILVYNTLSNHYLTIPTRYRGPSRESGLIGPVRLEFREKLR